MMTWEETFTPDERKCIQELEKRTIHDCSPKMLEDPILFYRFSKARDFDLKQAEAMLRKHISFRKEYQVDTILKDYKPPEVLLKYLASTVIGSDKDGNPVRYIPMSTVDMKGLFKSSTVYDLLKYNFYITEQDVEFLKQQSQKLGRRISTITYIYDFSKMNFAKATHKEGIEMMILGTKIYQDNYPERIKALYVINASHYFTMLFSFIKHLIANAVMEKMNVYGSDGWKEVLSSIMDPEILPAFLGGKRTDPDGNPLCKTFVNHGEIVPEKYYLQKSSKTLHQESGVKKLTVTRFSSSSLTFEINEGGSILEWEFETKSKDIAFGVYFKDESKEVELVPKHRFDTCYEPQVGMYRCEKAGTYILTFDNSYSWIYPKEIYYRTKILPPQAAN